MSLYIKLTPREDHLECQKYVYPELGANPCWDHEIDRAHGSVSRAKEVGNKHGSKRSANIDKLKILDQTELIHLHGLTGLPVFFPLFGEMAVMENFILPASQYKVWFNMAQSSRSYFDS